MKGCNAIIRMGAAHWDCRVNANGNIVTFDFRKMTKANRHRFRREFVKAYRTAQQEAA